jgi:hypothetical protein
LRPPVNLTGAYFILSIWQYERNHVVKDFLIIVNLGLPALWGSAIPMMRRKLGPWRGGCSYAGGLVWRGG